MLCDWCYCSHTCVLQLSNACLCARFNIAGSQVQRQGWLAARPSWQGTLIEQRDPRAHLCLIWLRLHVQCWFLRLLLQQQSLMAAAARLIFFEAILMNSWRIIAINGHIAFGASHLWTRKVIVRNFIKKNSPPSFPENWGGNFSKTSEKLPCPDFLIHKR